MARKADHVVLICSRCRGEEQAATMRDTLAPCLPSSYAIRLVPCMAGCASPPTVGFQAAGKAQYLFGTIASSADVAAIAAFAQQYEGSADGWTTAAERPRALFAKTLARIPAVCSGAAT
ncbi:MAG: DUF1636 family protein [Pseudomonadota bacterium]